MPAASVYTCCLPKIWLYRGLLVAGLVWFCGCGRIVRVKVVCLKTDITAAANQNQPIAVDVLLVRDKDLIKKLMTLSAADWFEKRAQFSRDYPDPKELVVYHREWVPGQVIPCSSIPLKPVPRATILFANYFTKGDHRARLVNGKSAAIHLKDEDFEIVPATACSRTSCPEETP